MEIIQVRFGTTIQQVALCPCSPEGVQEAAAELSALLCAMFGQGSDKRAIALEQGGERLIPLDLACRSPSLVAGGMLDVLFNDKSTSLPTAVETADPLAANTKTRSSAPSQTPEQRAKKQKQQTPEQRPKKQKQPTPEQRAKKQKQPSSGGKQQPSPKKDGKQQKKDGKQPPKKDAKKKSAPATEAQPDSVMDSTDELGAAALAYLMINSTTDLGSTYDF
jgi:outer membrane biosynthesis protein TonB